MMNTESRMYAGDMAHVPSAMPMASGSTMFSSYRGAGEPAPSTSEGATKTNGTAIAAETLTSSHTGSSRDESDSDDPTTPASDLAQQQHDTDIVASGAGKPEDPDSQQSGLVSDTRARLISDFDERKADVGQFLGPVTPLIPKATPLHPPSNLAQASPITSPAPSAPCHATSPGWTQKEVSSNGAGGFSNRSSPLSDIPDGDSMVDDENAGRSASTSAQEKKTAKRAASVKKGPTKARKQKTDATSPPAPNKRRKLSAQVSVPQSETNVDETAGEAGSSTFAARFGQDNVTTLLASQQSIPEDLDQADRAAMEAAMAEDLGHGSRPRRAASNKSRPSYVEVHAEAGDAADNDSRPRKEKTAKVKGIPRAPAGVMEIARFQMSDRWYEYQASNCQRSRWSRWYQCTHCTARQMGDTCRFINLRIFPLRNLDGELTPADPEDKDALDYAPFFGDELPRKVIFDYPEAKSLYPSATPESIGDIKRTVAASLYQTMKMELDHAARPETLWRNPELLIRPQCDFCLTSLFSASYCCRCCGKEYCLECTEVLKGKEHNSGKWNETSSVEKCRFRKVHTYSELWPLTRFRLVELQEEVREMERAAQSEMSAGRTLSEAVGRLPEQPVQLDEPQETALPAVASRSVPLEERTRQWYKSLDGPTVDRAIGSHQLTELHAGEDEAAFRRLWAKGEPLIVHDCIREPRRGEESEHDEVVKAGEGPASKAPPAEWGPENFCTSRWQREPCRITRCDADNVHQDVYVSDFFSTFGKSSEEKVAKLGKGIWKLKDWPPSSAFDDAFPDLYRHFNKALPVPAFTRRDGRMNISALFPTNANAPDLGPKMYNAWPSSEDQVGMGSTRLHMDIADAVNIMYYAAKPPNAEELPLAHRDGVAAWDIFPAGDSNKIRDYLRETRKVEEHEDPIHSQRYFLDAGDRQKLWDTKGVRSWRIYQKARDAIFIPAGCAHQVCNLTDCMKIAVDFVSPENVARCFRLTAEFRALSNNKVRSWKEDVLQLKSMLWHAWRACREMEGHKYDAGGAVQVENGQLNPPTRYSKPFEDLKSIHKIIRGKKKKKKKQAGEEAMGVDSEDAEDESMLDGEVDDVHLPGSRASKSVAKTQSTPKVKTKAKGKAAAKAASAASVQAEGDFDVEEQQPSSPPISSSRAPTSKLASTCSRRKGKSPGNAAASGSAIVIADDEDDDDDRSQEASSSSQSIGVGISLGRPKRQAAAASTKRMASMSWYAEETEADQEEMIGKEGEEEGEEESDEDEAIGPVGRRKKPLPLSQAKSKGRGKEKAASKARSASTKIPPLSTSSPSSSASTAPPRASSSATALPSFPPLPPISSLSPSTPSATLTELREQVQAEQRAEEKKFQLARQEAVKRMRAAKLRLAELNEWERQMRERVGIVQGKGEVGDEDMRLDVDLGGDADLDADLVVDLDMDEELVQARV